MQIPSPEDPFDSISSSSSNSDPVPLLSGVGVLEVLPFYFIFHRSKIIVGRKRDEEEEEEQERAS